MMRATMIFTLCVLSGCSALRDPREIAWQALNVVDAMQTDTFRDDPCLKEGHPLTRAMIGSNPSRESVVAWAVGGAAFHAGVSEWLIRTDRARLLSVWQWVSLTDKGVSVAMNFDRGVRIGSGNRSCGSQ